MRCYNGAPDSELAALWDDTKLAHRQLGSIGKRAVYFPVEQKWLVFDGIKPLPDWHDSVRSAANFHFKEQNEHRQSN